MLLEVMLDLYFSGEALKREFSISHMKNVFIAVKKAVVLLCLLKKKKELAVVGFLMMRYLQIQCPENNLIYYVDIAKELHKPSGGNLASESLVENLLNQQKNIEFLVKI